MSDKILLLVAGFMVGLGVGLNIPPAHADPIQCDPLTPLFDFKYCYAMHQLQGSPSVDKDGHPYYGWGHN